jgi:hypothetical protein
MMNVEEFHLAKRGMSVFGDEADIPIRPRRGSL